MSNLYKVAIVGRVNVGKSSLFNKLISNRKAITSSVAGTTRDRNYAVCSWRDIDFNLIDTGGLERQSDDDIDQQIIEQAEMAINEADLILFVVDSKTGIMPADNELARKLKKSKKPVILVANKADNQRFRLSSTEFYKLNLGEPLTVSALNGSGTGDMLDELVIKLKKIKKKKVSKETSNNQAEIKVSIIGKPNVGKSSLVNAILGEQRVIVSSIPHTTRDAQDIEFKYKDNKIVFVDTAGMRRRSKKSKDPFEKQSIEQSLQTIKKSDIAILVSDVSKKLSWQEKHLIDEVSNSGLGLIIVANKWDLIPDKDTNTAKEYDRYYKSFFPFINWAPIIYASAKQKLRITKILDLILEIYEQKNKTLSENVLDKFLKNVIRRHKPSRGKGTMHPYIYSLVQTAANPPRFAIKTNFKADLHSSYLRFLENNLRYKFGFTGTPIKINVIKSQNTQDKK